MEQVLTEYAGIAAADELSALLTADDFEPTIDVDTTVLDATETALLQARALVASLETLRRHLAAAGAPTDLPGLTIDVQLVGESLAAALTDITVDGTFEVRGGVIL